MIEVWYWPSSILNHILIFTHCRISVLSPFKRGVYTWIKIFFSTLNTYALLTRLRRNYMPHCYQLFTLYKTWYIWAYAKKWYSRSLVNIQDKQSRHLKRTYSKISKKWVIISSCWEIFHENLLLQDRHTERQICRHIRVK